MADFFYNELESITRWVKSATGLTSLLLSTAPPKIARPVILWEAPLREPLRNNSRYAFVNRVRQFGKLFAANHKQLLTYQGQLQLALEDNENIIAYYEDGEAVGFLKNARITFETTDTLDVPFSIEYEAGYSRKRPEDPPPPRTVTTKTIVKFPPGG